MTTTDARISVAPDDWRIVLRRYLAFVAVANLAWEMLHLPLYTIWTTGSAGELAFAVAHCTAGDLLIATASLVLALLLVGTGWPVSVMAHARVGALAMSFGVGYTLFSEWLNIVVRRSWSYSDLMPVIPVIDTGLSPVAQWIVLPLAGLWWARRRVLAGRLSPEGVA